MYEIYIRDSYFRKMGQISDFKKLEFIPRFNAVGSFVLDIPTESEAARELFKPKYGIVVRKNGKTLFSGTVKSRKRSFSAERDFTTFFGKDDMQYLASRIAYPATGGDFSTSSYDIRTGIASSVLMEYVDLNCGPNALSYRKILELGMDKGLGSIVTGRARFHNLLEFLSTIALKGGGLGFNVVQVDDSLQFQVYQPTDKTKSAFFSPLLGNLSEFEYSHDDPEANAVIVGGAGEGKARILKGKQNSFSVSTYGRIETFVDQRNTNDDAELNQSLDAELVSKAEQSSFHFTPIDTPQLSFGRDYNLGDKVSVVLTRPNQIVEYEEIQYFLSLFQITTERNKKVREIQEKLDVIHDVVREVKITIDSNGYTIIPTVGTDESKNNWMSSIYDKQKKLERRISNLERM